jgi:hypothetical protein
MSRSGTLAGGFTSMISRMVWKRMYRSLMIRPPSSGRTAAPSLFPSDPLVTSPSLALGRMLQSRAAEILSRF